MHVVIVGCGRVGSGLAQSLDKQGHSVAIVDKRETAFQRLPESFNGKKVVGLGFDRSTLAAAGINEATGFAAVTSGDNSNVLAARVAKENFEVPKVVARIYDPQRAEIYERLGISTVATVAWTVDQIEKRLLANAETHAWTDATGEITLYELAVPDAWSGKKFSQAAADLECTLVSLTRRGKATLAGADTVVQTEDILHVALRKESISILEELLVSQGGH